MTFPIPPLNPETESLEMAALSPSSKVFVAATIIFIGSVVALIHAQIPVASLANLPNEVVDQNLVAAPLPDIINSTNQNNSNELQPEIQVALTELKRENFEPTVAAGNVKYTQAYQQPIIDIPKKQQTSATNIIEPKPFATPNQNQNIKQESDEQQNDPKIKSVDFRPMQTPTDVNDIWGTESKNIAPNKTSMPTPTVAPSTEVSDAMLPLMQFAENLKSTQQSELGSPTPVDLFQPEEPEMVTIHSTNDSDLVPLMPTKN
jgi:hypothetical protein